MGTYTENIRLYEPGHRPPRLGEAKRAEREGEGFLRDRFLRESILVPVLLHGFWDFSLSVDSPWMTAAFYAFVLVFFLSANHRLRAASEDDQQL